MMAINHVSMNSSNLNVMSDTSASTSMEAKALQTQLAGKKQSLNRLSSEVEMTASDREKERRKIQREITELNRKLQQERLKIKDEANEAVKEQTKKKIIKEELLEQTNSTQKEEQKNTFNSSGSDNTDEKTVNTDIPVVTIKNILTAAADVNLETVQENIAQQLQHQQDVLVAEIQSDTLYGTDTTSKKETLSDMRRQKPIQIESIGQQPEQITPAMDFGSKIIIRE